MSIEANKEFLERYAESLSGKPKPPEVVNRFVEDQSLRDHIQMFEAAFPNYELSLEDMVAEDDRLAVHAIFRGVHRGDFNGIPATGREVTVPVMLFYRISGEKIVQFSMTADTLGLMQQLGAVPVPA